MSYDENSIQSHRGRTFWILVVVISSTVIASGLGLKGYLSPKVSAVQPQEKERLVVRDNRPVAEAIVSLETRFGRVITYEDPPLVHPEDLLDVTETVRRDLDKYPPGKAPKVFVPRGGELNLEYGQDDPVEVVLASVLSESQRAMNSPTFRSEETNGIIHVIPESVKGLAGDTIRIRSILDAPVQLSAQPRTGMQMLEAWCDSVSASSKKQVLIGLAPIGMLLNYKDDKGLSSPNGRAALTEILTRATKGAKVSWQLFYDPGQKIYVINIHPVQ